MPLRRSFIVLFTCYAMAAVLDLCFIAAGRDDLRWFSKPLLMPLLITALAIGHYQKRTAFYLVFGALFFSWCGDILLQAQGLFIPGLVSFLLAHVFYIIYLNRAGSRSKGFLQRNLFIALLVFAYVIVLVFFLFPYLNELKIPVFIYSIVIGIMLMMAVNTKDRVEDSVSSSLIIGAIMFVVSDSLLAINLFVAKNTILALLVMATYALAQFMIVRGALMFATRRSADLQERLTGI